MKKKEKTIKEKIADIVKLLDENQIAAVKFDKFMDKAKLEALGEKFTQVLFHKIDESQEGNLCIVDNVDLLYKDLDNENLLYNAIKDKKGKFILLFRNGITRKVFANKGSKFYGIKIYDFGCKTKDELKEQVINLLSLYKIKDLGDDDIEKIINFADSKDFYIEKIVKEVALEKIKSTKKSELIDFAWHNTYNENILKHELIVGKAYKKAYLMDILVALANNVNPYNAIDMVAGNTAKYIAMLENDGLVDSELVGVSKFIYKIADPFFKEYLRINFEKPEIKGYLLRQNKRG
ncbi:TPA: hypothetical protein RPW20_000685 [Campylobacter fetus subsp. venerealis]|nr:hypothetical protein [Campylobacter fetus subsp. venerealis]HDX6324040.1 hypothetical protein [Campylobacter fetus subsp. venerealis]